MKQTDPKTVELMNEINECFGKIELNYYQGSAGQYGEKTEGDFVPWRRA